MLAFGDIGKLYRYLKNIGEAKYHKVNITKQKYHQANSPTFCPIRKYLYL